jgi:hypothetical protein
MLVHRLGVPLVALAMTGCATISNSGVVAGVDDTELTEDEWQDRLTELGVTGAEVLPGDPVRAELTRWIQSELITDDDAAAVYDLGVGESGVVCLEVLVVDSEDTGALAVDEIESGRTFAEVFAEFNLDPSLAEATGAIPCLSAEQVEESAEVPFVQVASGMSADAAAGLAPLDGADPSAGWVVLGFRRFADLDENSRAEVLATLDVSDIAADAEVYVDPRYGVFDATIGQVVALG